MNDYALNVKCLSFPIKYNLSIDLFSKNHEIPILVNLSLFSEHLTPP